MKHAILFIGFLMLLIPSQAAVQVYSPVEVLVMEQATTFNQKTDKETRRALRQEFKKARKEAKAAGEKSSAGIAIIGFSASLLSFLFMFGGLLGAASGIIGLLLFATGITLSSIAMVWIKNGKMDKKYQWMPITSLVLAGVQLLVFIAALIFVVALISLFG